MQGITCSGLASHPGGEIVMLLVASHYRRELHVSPGNVRARKGGRLGEVVAHERSRL